MSIFLVLLSLTLWFCNSGKTDQKADEKVAPLTISTTSGAFNESFARLLNNYFSLRDALVEADSVKVNASATTLQLNASNLKLDEIGGDTTGTIRETAKLFAETISGSANALAGEDGLEAKRREFNMISDALWSLTRTVQYDGQKVYYLFCPMALDNSGGYWLSQTPDIGNPYYGNEMLTCGEVKDSLDYSKR